MATATITELEEPVDREAFLKLAKYPLIKHTDMLEEMRIEAVELCVSAIEKFPANLEKVRWCMAVASAPAASPCSHGRPSTPALLSHQQVAHAMCPKLRLQAHQRNTGLVEGRQMQWRALYLGRLSFLPVDTARVAICVPQWIQQHLQRVCALHRRGEVRSGGGEAWDATLTVERRWLLAHTQATQMIKEGMDKKFGAPWHVVIGEGFSFEITYEVKNLLYMFTGGTHAALVWK